MTTPRSQAGQTAADGGPGAPDQGRTDLESPYAGSAPDFEPAPGYAPVSAAPGYDYAADLPPGWPGAAEQPASEPAISEPGISRPAEANLVDAPQDDAPAGRYQAPDPYAARRYEDDQYEAADSYGSGRHGTGQPQADRYEADRYGADRYGADRYGADRYGADRYGADRYGAAGGYAADGDVVEASADASLMSGESPADEFLQDPGPATPGPAGGGPGGTGPTDSGSAAAESAGSSVMRSSGVMAIGTIASRVTGFLRTAIIIFALGTKFLGDAYNIANTLPNAVYNLALGGILTSVVVPLLVSAAKRDKDRGEAYDQRIFTLGVLTLGGITLIATVAAAPIAGLYAHDVGSASAHHLTVIFAYFFIPQIFFYGVTSLAGAILNSRGSFAAPMWTPVVNNVVVIGVGGAFMVTAGLNRTPGNISATEIGLLGIGTTLGIVLQTAALVPSLRRVGFRWRPRTDFRRAEVSEIGRMGGWMFGYVLTTQVAFLVTTQVANAAGSRVPQQGAGAGFAAYSNAWQLFQLPYAIVGISVITAMLPRMSAHAAAGERRLVAADFSAATRLASVIVVPAALVLAVLGAPLAQALFAHGSTSAASARYLGVIFAVFSVGLLPYMLFQLQLRVFYSMHDSRTPALIGVATMAMNIVANYVALAILPPSEVVAGLGAGFGLANLLGSILAWRILTRRLGGLDGRTIFSSLVRMHGSAIPAVLFAVAMSLMVGVILPTGMLSAITTVVLAFAGALLLYVLFAKAFRVRELAELTETVTGRFRR